jgi:hypothetical protein
VGDTCLFGEARELPPGWRLIKSTHPHIDRVNFAPSEQRYQGVTRLFELQAALHDIGGSLAIWIASA